jgi:hypothetical protein
MFTVYENFKSLHAGSTTSATSMEKPSANSSRKSTSQSAQYRRSARSEMLEKLTRGRPRRALRRGASAIAAIAAGVPRVPSRVTGCRLSRKVGHKGVRWGPQGSSLVALLCVLRVEWSDDGMGGS